MSNQFLPEEEEEITVNVSFGLSYRSKKLLIQAAAHSGLTVAKFLREMVERELERTEMQERETQRKREKGGEKCG